MCYPVCWIVNIKESLLLIEKSIPCSGGTGFFSDYLSVPTIYKRKQNVFSENRQFNSGTLVLKGHFLYTTNISGRSRQSI